MKPFFTYLLILAFTTLSFAKEDFSKLSKQELKKKLTPLQYEVTQEDGTERAFKNKYWDNKQAGIYVDLISGVPLFTSLDKYKSGTGWPSFTKPINQNVIMTKKDTKFFRTRIEVRGKKSDSHLGHVFEDGPKDKGGLRYCMNSASLKFIPYEKLEEKGYGEYKKMFNNREKAYFAGGCFWGMEHYFKKLDGVIDTEVGYMGGEKSNASYKIIKKGKTKHAETLQVTYDPTKVSYRELVKYFFRLHDPTTLNRQKNDVGTQYRSAIFPGTKAEEKEVQDVVKLLKEHKVFKNDVVTRIEANKVFYPAEPEHQDYLRKNPDGYNCHLLGKKLPFN